MSFLILALFLACYLSPFPKDLENYTKSGLGVIGIGNESNAQTWRIQPVEEIAQGIREIANTNEIVLSSWPGFLLSSNARSFPGLENHFGLYIGETIEEEDRRLYKIMSWSEFAAEISKGSTRLIALEERFIRRKMQEALKAGGYQPVRKVQKFTIFERKSGRDKELDN